MKIYNDSTILVLINKKYLCFGKTVNDNKLGYNI